MLGTHPISASWKYILSPDILALPIRQVKTTNCNECTMMEQGKANFIKKGCATFFPSFPNFIVGEMIVEDVSPEIPTWVTMGRGDPLWLHTPVLEPHGGFEVVREKLETRSYSCPLYTNNGFCSIYEHRHSTCMTWHCKYPSERVERLWNTLEKLMLESSIAAAMLIMKRLGLDYKLYLDVWYGWKNPYREWFSTYNIDDELYRRLWGQWYGREEEYYIRCFEELESLGDNFRVQMIAFQNERLRDTNENRPYLELMAKRSKTMYFSEHPQSVGDIVKEMNIEQEHSLPRLIPKLEEMLIDLFTIK